LEFPQISSAEAQARGLDVIVYPNPYRIDGDYRSHGFEGREREDLPDQRVRALNFTNLPHQCVISIFSIDGDLIHQFQHDFPLDAPGSMHDAWNLITRNSQLASSGIYYFTIETPAGATQIGKFALIM
ncbi:MAG: hypothetical protein IIB00_11000, partial [candidate division Zixibacteria bacterium]|nr:hypothetical protein [candidate division Zixibacteria bacterium]